MRRTPGINAISLAIWQVVTREFRSDRLVAQALGTDQRPVTRSTARTGPLLISSIFGGSRGSLISVSCSGGQYVYRSPTSPPSTKRLRPVKTAPVCLSVTVSVPSSALASTRYHSFSMLCCSPARVLVGVACVSSLRPRGYIQKLLSP